MIDPVVARMIEQLTRLEASQEINLPMFNARLEKVEHFLQQLQQAEETRTTTTTAEIKRAVMDFLASMEVQRAMSKDD